MARPKNWKKHSCVYCLKYPLHGVHRALVLTDISGSGVPSCKTCKNMREKYGATHEEFLNFSLQKMEKTLKRMRGHLADLAVDRQNYTLEFREKFGSKQTRDDVAHLREAFPELAEKSRVLSMLSGLGAEIEDNDE